MFMQHNSGHKNNPVNNANVMATILSFNGYSDLVPRYVAVSNLKLKSYTSKIQH